VPADVPKPSKFDAAYYARYYEAKATRVYGPEEIAHLARGVVEMIRWYGETITSVLDVGAGTGMWRDWFGPNVPNVRYHSIEVSEFACAMYGHERRDITRWRAKSKFDLIVCQGVLPYLSDEDAESAIENIAAMAGGFLYLEAITKRDLLETCDRDATDVAIHPRAGAWYRARLRRHFVAVGGGLYYVKGGPLVFYELERGE
jgi:hypothetical protein